MRIRLVALAAAFSVVPVSLSPVSPAGAAQSTIAFSGYSWTVKSSSGLAGPGPNVFSDSPDNVWVDAAGRLHLRVTYRDGQWRAAEIVLNRSLGYGTYRFTLESSVGRLDPNVVLGLFTWSDSAAYHHREIDVEFTRWGDATDPTNAQYVVQPYDRPGNLVRFRQPDVADTAHSFTWSPKSLRFASTTAAGEAIAAWTHTGRSVPKSGDERVRINLWLVGGVPPIDGAEVEVVVSQFSFSR